LFPATPAAEALNDPELVHKYARPEPRYSSYPTPDRFVEAYDARAHQITLRQRNKARGPGASPQPLSLYVHLPFCNTDCYFCMCHKVVTGDRSRSARYLRYLDREFSLVADMLEGGRRVGQVLLGGGTPSFLSTTELQDLMGQLRKHFELLPGEYAIEIDPRTVDAEKIVTLGQLGFNHMSIGVQDLDATVQMSVNRVQTVEETTRTILAARRSGFTSINVDLIYGLPKQTATGFSDTLDQILVMKPDRIALYSYTHQPGRFESQRRINVNDLPSAEVRQQIVDMTIDTLTGAGYVYIGLDHFALPHDELAVAATRAGLHRNFQGYSTRPEGDLIAFGISAISKVGATYSQNANTLDEYYELLDRGELPVTRGIKLTADDLLRRTVIQSLMCHFELSIESIEIAYLMKFREYFSNEWDKLEALERDGLITLEPEWITVTARGRLLVRRVAVVFDRHLSRGERPERFSKAI
jgi:oxygen-independent coproporphyrinogen-3 oxidase